MKTQVEIEKLKGEKCPKCAGTGYLFDPASVRLVVSRFLRESGMSQNAFGEALGLSRGFTANLMNGKRRWTPQLVEQAVKIIERQAV